MSCQVHVTETLFAKLFLMQLGRLNVAYVEKITHVFMNIMLEKVRKDGSIMIKGMVREEEQSKFMCVCV